MKWHDYPLALRLMRDEMNFQSDTEVLCRMERLLTDPKLSANFSTGQKVAFRNSMASYIGEQRWVRAKRPYYDVYPSIVEAFLHVDLDKVMCDHVRLPLKDLLVRFQVGHELPGGDGGKVRSFLMVSSQKFEHEDIPGVTISMDDWYKGQEKPSHSSMCITFEAGTTIASRLRLGHSRSRSVPECGLNNETTDNVFRFAVALCLLKDNPDLIEPEPIDADRDKWERDHDPALIAKAERRGKRCWSIGKHIEVAPGFRRPHFAIRWCGKGGNDPQLRPIKGCLVRRHKIEEVPTGYMDEAIEAILIEE